MNVRRVLVGTGEVVRYALMFVWGIFCPKAVLAARLLAAESQLAACKHEIAAKKQPRPRFTPGFRLLWVVLSKCLDRWEDLAHLMQPATVKKWHTRAFQHFWRWKSCRKGGRLLVEHPELIDSPILLFLPLDVLANLGMLLAELNRPREAEHAFRAALKADPNLAAAAYNLGVLLAEDRPGPDPRPAVRPGESPWRVGVRSSCAWLLNCHALDIFDDAQIPCLGGLQDRAHVVVDRLCRKGDRHVFQFHF